MAIAEPIKVNELAEMEEWNGGIYESIMCLEFKWNDYYTKGNKVLLDKINEILDKDVQIYKVEIEVGKPIKVYYYPSKEELKRVANN